MFVVVWPLQDKPAQLSIKESANGESTPEIFPFHFLLKDSGG
jgi:hypothetical protein